GEAEDRSRWLAERLVAAGAGKGARIGLHHGYGTEVVVGLLAVARTGGVAMPLSTAYTPHELGRAIRRGDIDTLIVPPTLMGRDELAALEEALPGLADCGAGPLHLSCAPYLRRIWVTGSCDRPWGVSIDLTDDTP